MLEVVQLRGDSGEDQTCHRGMVRVLGIIDTAGMGSAGERRLKDETWMLWIIG
jgi:hypothetical protein